MFECHENIIFSSSRPPPRVREAKNLVKLEFFVWRCYILASWGLATRDALTSTSSTLPAAPPAAARPKACLNGEQRPNRYVGHQVTHLITTHTQNIHLRHTHKTHLVASRTNSYSVCHAPMMGRVLSSDLPCT